ncbi:hypothetical protein SMACR_02096 [Sordaria macrospora]|uniref:WGS project CABT00000000 data, contig 2.18 n=2 Tax=Sordaria macrospora TaxID=5147 RepID=F7W0Y7_SORMK|nr:uncharacterized protein SMAC_02096 [Sordaria macrospora k-hell]KAA8629635.1 hypothetical protein SMACR_02096 [Sordaria macrospora]KAH7629208.1 O-methyltransferase-domain-containing protein [Sordaria sp. MPI-SDFR-AT-0083]WPJ63817.1 hypothetical protein SMAC4_02096 [Sordaria macrospora]CCC11439.1 unnamed protein product [Sordaria macrospora k-hell]
MKRLLRYYQAFNYIRQPADNQYGATTVTKSITGFALTSGAGLFYHMNAPTFMALPKFLAKNNYQNPNDISDCPFQVGHNTDLSLFPWFQQRPEMGPDFLNWMNSHCSDLPRFYDSYDIKQELWQNADADTILQAALSSKTKALLLTKKATPLPGFDGIGAQVHDFFTPQPLKGARAYYFRNVFHDWSNDICAKILANIRPAMAEDSVILIDEIVLSERGSIWRATQFDIAMLTLLGASDRTANEWHTVLAWDKPLATDEKMRACAWSRHAEMLPAVSKLVDMLKRYPDSSEPQDTALSLAFGDTFFGCKERHPENMVNVGQFVDALSGGSSADSAESIA